MTLPKAKILIVDDEAGIRFFLEEILTNDGHDVIAVDSGVAALSRIKSEEFDLALIDLKLPGVDGMAVLSALRQRWPNTITIMLTAHASLETAVSALRQGAHDYLFKPCKTIKLRESIRGGLQKRQDRLHQNQLLSLLEQTGPSHPSETPPPSTSPPAPNTDRFLEWDGLIVDLIRHVITLNGHLLELSPTEFDLLAYLVSEAPRVISSQELVRQVQGYDSDPVEARDIVRYHVYRIRRKAQKKANVKHIIRTVRGVGYTIHG